MNKPATVVFAAATIFCASLSIVAQNIPSLSGGIIKLINEKEPGWKFVPSKEKRGSRSTLADFNWKFKRERVEAVLNETKSAEDAARELQIYASEGGGKIANLGDENYVAWGEPGVMTNVFFRRGRARVFLTATSAEIAERFARHIDHQIQATVFTEKWEPEDTVIVELTVKDFIKDSWKIQTPVDVSRGVGSGGGYGMGCGCGAGTQNGGCKTAGGSDSYSLSVYKIERDRVFLKMSVEVKNWTADQSGNRTETKSGKWDKKFSVSRRGITEKDLGEGVKVKAFIEKRESQPPF